MRGQISFLEEGSSVRSMFLLVCLIGVVLGLTAFTNDEAAEAQEKSRTTKKPAKTTKKTSANVKSIDIKSENMQANYVKEAITLSDEYIEAGYHLKAKSLLESVVTIVPDRADVQEKLKSLDELIMSSNEQKIEIDSSEGWQATGLSVFENRSIRVEVEGKYRLDLTVSETTADGLSSNLENPNDYVVSLPFGALIGMVPEKNKPGPPFVIGSSAEYTPKFTGPLFLRVNTPVGSKNIGKLKINITGFVQGAQ